jgi:hypothetical protein
VRTLVNHCLLHFNLQEQSEMLSHLGWADGNGHELPPLTPGVRVCLLLVSLSGMIRDLHSFHEDCYTVNLPSEDKHLACYTTMSKISDKHLKLFPSLLCRYLLQPNRFIIFLMIRFH